MRYCVALSLLLGLCFFTNKFTRADWPEFRGPGGQGVVRDAKIPLVWNDSENAAWSVDIAGKAWSSPVVLGDLVWLTTAVGSQPSAEQIQQQFAESGLTKEQFTRRQVAGSVSLRAMAVRRKDGTLVHDVEIFNIPSPRAVHIGNSYASPTPVLEAGRIYCHFDAGTACVDTATGTIVWQRRIPVVYSVGAGSSPVICGDLLVLPCDGIDTQFVIALDKHSGETVWKTPRPPFRNQDGQHRKAFSTPLVVNHEGHDQLVIPGAQWMVAYEPLTGEEIWRVDHGVGFSTVPRPVAGHGMVYCCTGFGSKELWAIRLGGRGDVTDTHVAWKQNSQIPTNSSPVLVGDLILLTSDTGIASCIDALTGKQCWKHRIGGQHSASPICVDGRVYFFSHEGQVTILQAAREYVELAQFPVDGQIMASPIVLKTAVLLRTDSALYCIE